MVIDFDDFGATHKISEMCQTNDCRAKLDELHYLNGNFKVTLFAVPGEMTAELCEWCKANESWIELAQHGFFHRTNYECEKMTTVDLHDRYLFFQSMLDNYFGNGFKAPGWQISNDWYKYLKDNDMWVADQGYNQGRRPDGLKSYVISDDIPHWHGHCWDCVGNGIYETFEQLKDVVKNATDFQFISEVVK